MPNLSEYEVFETDHSDLILADSIDGPANVLSIEDFEKLEDCSHYHFQRAKYFSVKHIF